MAGGGGGGGGMSPLKGKQNAAAVLGSPAAVGGGGRRRDISLEKDQVTFLGLTLLSPRLNPQNLNQNCLNKE